MSDSESVKKMLRAVLQSSKIGVSVASLHSEYRSLCGENIPLKKLGFSNLEDYLRSIPSVARLDYRMGELKCFASVCEETAHIAELVSKQKSSKKSQHSQLVSCKMRFKHSNPYMLNVSPQRSLRQPSARRDSYQTRSRSWTNYGYRTGSASGDYRYLHLLLEVITAQVLTRVSVSLKICLYDVDLVQSRVKQLMKRYSSGVWMSKVPEFYSQMFAEKIHPQALLDLEKWPRICSVEKPSVAKQDKLIYPPVPLKPLTSPLNNTDSSPESQTNSTPVCSRPITPTQQATTPSPLALPKTRDTPRNLLANPTFIFPLQHSTSDNLLPSVVLQSSAHKPRPADQLSQSVRHPTVAHNRKSPTSTCSASTNGPTVAESPQPNSDGFVSSSSPSSSAPCPPPNPSAAAVVSAEVCQKLKELLSKYTQGMWASALPKLFMDTYKMPFPEQILDNLSLLLDICSVEYPSPHDKKKAVLYNFNQVDQNSANVKESLHRRSHPLPSGLEVVGSVVPPSLTPPTEQYTSVLVTEAKSCNAVTLRYVGENYSSAQETMEDAMQTFYSQNFTQHHVSNPIAGQLVAVRGEDGEEVTRGQVMDVTDPDRIFHVDYGFSVETSRDNLLELHQDFLSLPFQATNVRLAGLEAFSSDSLILSLLDKLAVGKILLMEMLQPCQQEETPVAVLYDTSQEEDVNINTACLTSLQDKSMNSPLSVNLTYQDVRVSSISADGTTFCQLPSRGLAKLRVLLEGIEAFFMSHMTSALLVSRAFSGKFCLVRYKGKWVRAEITNMHDTRVMDVLFIDLGLPATVEITDLREIPPPFLKDFIVIPPQAIKCQLAGLAVPEGCLSYKAVLWLKKRLLDVQNCKIKIVKLEDCKGEKVVYVYLFTGGDSLELKESINHQLTQSEMWQNLVAQNNCAAGSTAGLTPPVELSTLSSSFLNASIKPSLQLHQSEEDPPTENGMQRLPLPPELELPQPGQTLDVFVPVVCHPGYFVVQPWQDLHKLVVLMGEMVLYYNQTENTKRSVHIQKGVVYAAKIDKSWHRVQVRAVLGNGLVNVYGLDYGKHELVSSSHIQPLITEFRQLPFQAVAAQLAGVTQLCWSEEASMLFRSHVENKALVAQVEGVRDVSEVKDELWERRLTVYLVDTSQDGTDIWIHRIMADIGD
uniref:Tropomodulin 1 n=1 Tax=Nothobranchius furzeri TaxID=105023 RepID=A0A8C6LET7_NOTFU